MNLYGIVWNYTIPYILHEYVRIYKFCEYILQLCIRIHGDLYEFVGISYDPYEFIWIHKDFIWIHKCFIWIYTNSLKQYGFIWIPKDFCRDSYGFINILYGFIGMRKDSYGFIWISISIDIGRYRPIEVDIDRYNQQDREGGGKRPCAHRPIGRWVDGPSSDGPQTDGPQAIGPMGHRPMGRWEMANGPLQRLITP